ncbi:RagB/SusD family nutrient uptake outer membrane protein [Pedobacter cryoconitis]|uniref:Putative outer membrane starch-binding protein n=1 Tax=Pedobacter cryoconitis TaxID=188932 RepID=A0A327SW65_9SPHI|nr:RagB/SusD family nutrient uptake outer membrane protein [Pedobacter cryoconitis]RAJ31743.1 putative outer membrane starch-binding protein [Pedobacter cryoconitis]
MKKYTIILILLGTLSAFGCKDYLDAKPDKKLAVPNKISDLWALLDNYTIMNRASPVAGEDYTDNYYLIETSLNAIANVNTRNNYTWDDKGERIGDWSNPYRAIFYANVVLDELDHVKKNDPSKQEDLKAVQGSALFFRSFLFYEVAQIFAPQYSDDNLLLPCIPLRLNSDPNDLSFRSTVQETYDRIINDLKLASRLLPETSSPKNRPTKAAAFGLLGRVYLNTGDYQNAALYADSCLSIYRTLIDYNSLNKTTAIPIARFNDEVIFASRSYTESGLFGVAIFE